MYRTRTEPVSPLAAGGRGRAARRSSVQRNAASVLPLPVGAWIRVWRPSLTAAQPSACAWVGTSNVASNQARTAGLNGASGSAVGGAVATGSAYRDPPPDPDQFSRDQPGRGRA